MKTTDYCCSVIDHEELADLKSISDRPLSDIEGENNNSLLVLSFSQQKYDGDLGKKVICRIIDNDKSLVTNSLVGFVGINKTKLSIHSRFSKGDKDYFLHYLIKKVAGINLFSLPHSIDNDSVFNLLICLFPIYLKRALRQGIYKEYVSKKYNDANLRGVVDVGRHIHNNIPFNGKIAYSKREYSYDNRITQLIRHTIEYVRKSDYCSILNEVDDETKIYLRNIMDVTTSYTQQSRNSVLYKNYHALVHPYYFEYTPLQKLCMRILLNDEIRYGVTDDKIYGVLIDAAWLWEEYLARVISSKYNHYFKKRGRRFYLFENFQQIVPDFLSHDKRFVADAKYIPLENQRNYGEEKASAVYYKTITYMYRFCTNTGLLLYPHPDMESSPIHYKIKTEIPGVNGGSIIKIGLRIPNPERCRDFSQFVKLMGLYEEAFINELP